MVQAKWIVVGAILGVNGSTSNVATATELEFSMLVNLTPSIDVNADLVEAVTLKKGTINPTVVIMVNSGGEIEFEETSDATRDIVADKIRQAQCQK